MSRIVCSLLVALATVSIAPAAMAQQLQPAPAPRAVAPAAPIADGRDLLLRVPDRQVDGLFQAVHAAMRDPRQADALCALFDPQADRSLAGLNTAAARLSEASRARFTDALLQALVAATQHPPQAFDAAAAQQALKQAGVRAAMLNDGFLAGLEGHGSGDVHAARCDSIAMLFDALQMRPLAERTAVTRLLLLQGLDYLMTDNIAGPPSP